MLDRRTFIGGVVGGILAAPLAAEAQHGGKVYRIGYLSTPTRASVENGVQHSCGRCRAHADYAPPPCLQRSSQSAIFTLFARSAIPMQRKTQRRFVPISEELMR
jgi:hypothetical protein